MLAAITGGFRRLILSRGESVERVLRTLVPVSVRSATEHGTYNNRVSAMFADLPVGIEDPADRLGSITAQMADLKESHEAVAGEVLTSLGGLARRCCSRWPSASQRGSRSRASTRSPRTSPGRSIRCTRAGAGCSSPSPTSRSAGT